MKVRWICPQCDRDLNLGLEECPFCAKNPPPAPVRKVVQTAQYGLPSWKQIDWRHALDITVGGILLLVTVYMVVLWGWPDLIPFP